MEKELLNIKIQTLPNGYALTVGSEEYMYFTLEKLAQGFLYHVCLGELGAASNEDIKTFLDAAVVYRADNGKIAKRMVILEDENKRLSFTCDNQKKVIAKQKSALKKAREELEKKRIRGEKTLNVDFGEDEDEDDDE
jgi:hypothetical protein